MQRLNRWYALSIWALGDLMRHPLQQVMLFCALAALTALLGVILLLNQSLMLTADRLMAHTPTVVVRRVDAGGWAPLPLDEALACARNVPAVLQPRARIWGVAASAHGALQVVALSCEDPLPAPWAAPLPGQALIGPGIAPALSSGTELLLTGVRPVSLRVTGRLPEASAMALHDAVLVHAADARTLLGLSAEQASDLVLDVYHEEEIDAVVRDLVRSMPWPVHISTRPETARRMRAELAARSAAASVALFPAGLALATLVGAVGLGGRRQRRRMALFKALGWTSADILGLQLARALMISLPAMLVGLAAGYLLLFWPGISWVGRLLFGWNSAAPALYLTARSAPGPLLVTLLMVAVPFGAASFWAGRQGALADPADLLEEA